MSGKAADEGGLSPGEDNNAAWRESGRKDWLLYHCIFTAASKKRKNGPAGGSEVMKLGLRKMGSDYVKDKELFSKVDKLVCVAASPVIAQSV